jgi:antimicrobial peptide system SdpA family protein
MTSDSQFRLLGICFSAVALAATVLFVYGAHGPIPFNPAQLPGEKAIGMSTWFPQGWRFFTRDPQEPGTELYVRSADGSWIPNEIGPESKASFLFGLDRRPRAQSIELGKLVTSVESDLYQPCDSAPERCLERMTPLAQSLQNRSPHPTLCGDLAIVRRKPVPWAWARSAETLNMPSTVIRIRVTCS